MAGLDVDTSALGRVLLTEPDAAAIRATLSRYDRWWSSALLVVELRRLAARARREDRRRGATRRDGAASAGSPNSGTSLAPATVRGPIARRDPPRRRSRTTQRRRDRSCHDLRWPTPARLRAPPTRCGSADGRRNALARSRSHRFKGAAIPTNDNAAPERSGEVENTGATGVKSRIPTPVPPWRSGGSRTPKESRVQPCREV